ncbi:hypothetical protein PInf_026702 [Phytophthora infestans]|nr:hypothetical protein PInf_026702 [Phytophthora infestans]
MSSTMEISSHGDKCDARAMFGVDGSSFAGGVNAAMSTPNACIFQSATVNSADLNAESDSDVNTTCSHDVSYPGDGLARAEVSSAVPANSADQHSGATMDYASREVLPLEGTKPNDDPAMADSALETLNDETARMWLDNTTLAPTTLETRLTT